MGSWSPGGERRIAGKSADTTTAAVRVVVADDHEIVRTALRQMLQEAQQSHGLRFDLVAEAVNGLEAIAAVKAERPELLLLDLAMPLAGGVEIIHDVRRWHPPIRIVGLTGVTAGGLLANAVEMGVDALISKTSSMDVLLDRLPLILGGGRFIDPELATLIEQGQQAANLTDRERQILNMVVAGKSNKEIAALLNISPKTVDKHRSSMMQKLDVHSVAQLMARALKDGLIDSTV